MAQGKSLSTKEKMLIRLEAAVIIFGWHRLTGNPIKDVAVMLYEMFQSSGPDRAIKEAAFLGLLGADQGSAKYSGNHRQYLRTRFDHRQFQDDMESIRQLFE